MIRVPSTPPTNKVQVGTLAVGAGYVSANGSEWIKTGPTSATNLQTGVHVTDVVATEMVDKAPSAQYVMYPA